MNTTQTNQGDTMSRTPVTVEHVDDLADSTITEPTLVRWADGDLSVVHGSRVADKGTVIATQEDYWTYCDGQDDAEQRANFAADLAEHA